MQHHQGGLPRRDHPARDTRRGRGDRALHLAVHRAHRARLHALAPREREFVEASRSLGASNTRIIFREVLPNLIGPLLVYTTLLIPQSILFEAALSYLGLGVPPDDGLVGRASEPGAQHYYDVAWWLMLFPGLFLVMTTLAFNLLGDGLRDALDVRADR